MDRSIKCSNRVCFDRQIKQHWKQHRSFLKSIEEHNPHLDPAQSLPPLRSTFDQREMKRKTQKEDQAMASRILLHRSQFHDPDQSHIFISANLKRYKKNKRKLFQKSIKQDNKLTVQRVINQKSVYSFKTFQRDYQKNQHYASSVSLYKYKAFKPSHSNCNFWNTNQQMVRRKHACPVEECPRKDWRSVATLRKKLSDGRIYFLEMEVWEMKVRVTACEHLSQRRYIKELQLQELAKNEMHKNKGLQQWLQQFDLNSSCNLYFKQ